MEHNTIKTKFFHNGFVLVKNLLSKKEINDIFSDLEDIKKAVKKKINNITIFLQMENSILFII
jgi:hypothetical protein